MRQGETFRLRLIHFNDLHGRLADVSPDEIRPVFSRIAGFIRRARAETAGRTDAGVLVLAAGDDLVGSPFAELWGSREEQFRCHPSYRLYSAAGIDASVIGNHDLDWGLRMLALGAARDATFPLLSANLIPAPWADPACIHPYTIIHIRGVRVGIIGLTPQDEIKQVHPAEFKIADPTRSVLDVLPAVREQSDVVVILSHLGCSAARPVPAPGAIRDVELAAALPRAGVHAIVGGHTHTMLNARGLDPENLVNGILIAQAGSHGQNLGEVLLDVASDGVRVAGARLWAVGALPEDREFDAEHVAPLAAEVRQLVAEPLGAVTPHEDLDPQRVRELFATGESALANFVADALAVRCRGHGVPVDFVMLDGPAISDGLPRDRALMFGDLFRLAPYGDSLVLVRVPVGALQALLDDNARRVDLPGEEHVERGFAQFSRQVRYRIEGVETGSRSTLRAAGITLDGIDLAQLAATRAKPLLVACYSFFRQFARSWEQTARAQGLAIVELDTLPHEATPLALREELVAYVRQGGGVTDATGLARDGRVSSA